ncbi:MAG: class I SAM-dependent methyltransferase [Oscillochloris sp.]|nr:class I SAM-dependent methyltransferase [Oscillochloris sp.]
MTTNFNDLADTYGNTKRNLIKQFSEEPSFLAAIGAVAGLDVLDLACGDGYYTRMLKRAGARRVLGVDIAAAMVAGAEAAEEADPLGISYAVHDVRTLPEDLGTFDLVIATYLFHYAPTYDVLEAMFRSIAARLRPGGRLVSVGISPDLSADVLRSLSTYGSQISAETPLVDGAPLTVTIDTPFGLVTFQCHHWTWPAYAQALAAAGLVPAEQHPILVSDEGMRAHTAEFWHTHLTHPSLAVFSTWH